MVNKRELGGIYENKATELLQKNGYEILNKNFYGRKGELDIIAKKDNLLVIVEVKFRDSKLYGEGIEAINRRKLRRMFYTARQYIYENRLDHMDVRFDSICFFKNNVCWNKNLVWGDEIGF